MPEIACEYYVSLVSACSAHILRIHRCVSCLTVNWFSSILRIRLTYSLASFYEWSRFCHHPTFSTWSSFIRWDHRTRVYEGRIVCRRAAKWYKMPLFRVWKLISRPFRRRNVRAIRPYLNREKRTALHGDFGSSVNNICLSSIISSLRSHVVPEIISIKQHVITGWPWLMDTK